MNNNDLILARHMRERLDPQRKDAHYLHLSDLLLSIQKRIGARSGRLLDLGCGSSPYRTLFPGFEYLRADLDGCPDIDYPLSAAESIPSNHFDMVLSTQVLEHVEDPESYLGLAFRCLKPGGKILLTTHGLFEEHACPEDYYRWTALGLNHLLRKSGFEQIQSWKVTTQQRASAYFILRHFGLIGLKRRTIAGFIAAVTNRFLRVLSPLFHAWLDRHAGECRMVESQTPGHELYIVLTIEGIKPIPTLG